MSGGGIPQKSETRIVAATRAVNWMVFQYRGTVRNAGSRAASGSNRARQRDRNASHAASPTVAPMKISPQHGTSLAGPMLEKTALISAQVDQNQINVKVNQLKVRPRLTAT